MALFMYTIILMGNIDFIKNWFNIIHADSE